MAFRFDTIDMDGVPYEWKLERGGRLYARKTGTQRWRLLGKGFSTIEQAKAFTTLNHTEV